MQNSPSSANATASPIRLGPGERVIFVGQPSSGKTNLICCLLQPVERFTVIDSKMHPNEYPAYAAKQGIVVTRNPEDITVNPRVIFQISEIALRDRAGWSRRGRPGFVWTQAIRAMKAKGRGVVIFDEVIQTLPSSSAHPEAAQLFTQGAAFGISCWGGTQIPNRMETLLPRLAEHCFTFQLVNVSDQKILRDARGLDCSSLGQLPPYYVAYQKKPATQWTVLAPVPLVLPSRTFSSAPESDHTGAPAPASPVAS